MRRESSRFSLGKGEPVKLPSRTPLLLPAAASFPVQLDQASIDQAKQLGDLLFDAVIPLQGVPLKGKISFRGLEIAKVSLLPIREGVQHWWVDNQQDGTFVLPKDRDIGEGIALPKSFRDAGVLIGDRGFLSYYSPTASMLQEQQVPIFVAAFYDPGIIPIGGKYLLANRELTSLIRSSHPPDDKTAMTNGINIRFNDLAQVDRVKGLLLEALKKQGISHYWNVETYKEYEFTKEILHELQSQKNLFMMIAVVIVLVACSNIISMLIILVNDKKGEIGILRSMGSLFSEHRSDFRHGWRHHRCHWKRSWYFSRPSDLAKHGCFSGSTQPPSRA